MSEQVCEHGELRRQCVKCELASERDEYVRLAGELQSKLDRLQAEIDAPTIGWRDLWKAEQAKRIAAETRLVSVETELDEASPMRTCARCGKQDRSHRMAIEEGDEWECFPCWERCNAQERAALAVEEREPVYTGGVIGYRCTKCGVVFAEPLAHECREGRKARIE